MTLRCPHPMPSRAGQRKQRLLELENEQCLEDAEAFEQDLSLFFEWSDLDGMRSVRRRYNSSCPASPPPPPRSPAVRPHICVPHISISPPHLHQVQVQPCRSRTRPRPPLSQSSPTRTSPRSARTTPSAAMPICSFRRKSITAPFPRRRRPTTPRSREGRRGWRGRCPPHQRPHPRRRKRKRPHRSPAHTPRPPPSPPLPLPSADKTVAPAYPSLSCRNPHPGEETLACQGALLALRGVGGEADRGAAPTAGARLRRRRRRGRRRG
ncbi:hypothetical protein B0H19DRAFT_11147 [Mycena capillaripes]|nr:hypothetical protein B0H19DRAFT_11147 [Mycena capillaripes]